MNTTRRVAFPLALGLLFAALTGRAPARQATPSPSEADEMMATARSHPDLAYRRLNGFAARSLSAATQLGIAREALRTLAQKVEKDEDPFGTLRDIGDARSEAAGLSPAIVGPLAQLHAMAHRRALRTALDEALAGAKAGKWSSAAATAGLWAARLNDGDGRLRISRLSEAARDQNKTAKDACEALASPARLMAVVDAVHTSLADRPTAEKWVRVSAPGLSKKLGEQLDTLHLLRRLRTLAQKKDLVPLESRELTGVLFRLGTLGHEPLVKKVSVGLAVKALFEGRLADFDATLPENVPADKALAALRDLKALALGDGKVTTWAGKAAVPALGPVPADLAPLVPEARRRDWKPPTKDTTADAGSPVAQADVLFLKVAEQAREQLKAERIKLEADARKGREVVAAAQAALQKGEGAERRSLAGVEYRLGRRMRPEEKPTALWMVEQGKEADQAAKLLHQQVGGEEAFLNEVKRRLKRGLTAAELAQAKKLRKQGRRASEIAELLGE